MRYISRSRFRFPMASLEFFNGIIFRTHYGPEVDSASNINEYQEYFLRGKGGRCVGLTTLLSSRTDRLETWIYQPPGTLRACPGVHRYFMIKGNLQLLKITYGPSVTYLHNT